ncbi:MAG: hypothetical protein AAGB04_29355 [Pseudomonadota bacterium]
MTKNSKQLPTGKNLVKVSLPAILMPIIFCSGQALLTEDFELLRQSWQTIAPSSWMGAVIVSFVGLARYRAVRLVDHLGKAFGSLLTGLAIAALMGALALSIAQFTNSGLSLISMIASSAGVGAGVATAAMPTTEVKILKFRKGEKKCI